MLCQKRFVFFCECYRQYLKETEWDLVIKTAGKGMVVWSQQNISSDWVTLYGEKAADKGGEKLTPGLLNWTLPFKGQVNQ